jgi:RNA polymerase subunit RPABC4/transcription elongation factor Spt4
MLYCERCQVLCRDEQMCPVCGSRRLRVPEENDPVLLFTTDAAEAERITAAFSDEGIPHMERNLGARVPFTSLGKSRRTQTRVFVPFGEVNHAKDVMQAIGALGDESKETSEKTEKEAAGKEQEEPMSRGRRALLRIISAILFFALVAAAVFVADGIVEIFRGFFH